MSHPRVSIAMIVRDEADMAAGFIEAVRGLWDELIVVDTGSTDDTVALFSAAGASVRHHAWSDDFAEARNVALDAVTGDWVLVLDADERVSPEFIREFLSTIERPDVGALTVCVSNALPFGHERESRILRAWRTDPAIRFRHAIHEDATPSVQQMLARSGRKALTVSAPVAHLGYVRSRAAVKDKKQRDLTLLRACLQVDAFDFYSRLKLLEVARYWHDGVLWQAEARAAADALEASGRSSLQGVPWGGELISHIAEGLFRPDQPEAIAWLDGWVQWLTPSAAFYHRRAVMHEHRGALVNAQADFERCLSLSGTTGDSQLTSTRPRLGLARVAIAAQQTDEALEHVREAIDHSPRDPEALVAIATLTASAGGPAALDAWEATHRAILRVCPEREWAMGEALYALKDFRGAIARLRGGAGVPPRGPGAVRLAQALLADGQLEASEALCRSLVVHEAEAGLGVVLFDLLKQRNSDLELDLTEQTANAVMRQWVDALWASNDQRLRSALARSAPAVRTVFPWLDAWLARRAG
jgi:tetratricopeptide (TPR) repeat protein